MPTPLSAHLIEYLADRYARLGRPIRLTPLTHAFQVSNRHFEYTTTHGRFLAKLIAHPEALYGQYSVTERLEAVGRATCELHRAGLPVEQIVSSDEGNFVQQYDGQLLRLFTFNTGRGYTDRACDRLRSARALRRFHRNGLTALSDDTRRGLAGLEKAYPLHFTANKLPEIRLYLEDRADTAAVFKRILDQWAVIETAAERALNYRPVCADSVCLVHTDFHPRNVLFVDEAEQAVLIDLDNMIIDWRLPCLGFSILRFGLFHGERTTEMLHEAVRIFAADDQGKPGFNDDLHHAMITLEVEKVLRILYRVKATGKYAGFLDNVCPLHISNIKFLIESAVCA